MKLGVLAIVPDRFVDAGWQSRRHLLTRVSRHHPVLWINPLRDWRRLYRPEVLLRRDFGTRHVADDLWIHDNPPWLPKLYRPHFAADFLARRAYVNGVAHLRRLGAEKIIVSVWCIVRYESLPHSAADVVSYHVTDDYSFSTSETPTSPEEAALISKSTHTYFISDELYKKKAHLASSASILPNGVDCDLFANRTSEPDEMAHIPHPRIGYVGNIKSTLDFNLLDALTDEHPEWSFVFVGGLLQTVRDEAMETWNRITERKNVFALGRKDHPEVANYISSFDVGLLPYKNDDYTKYINPLKLKEYMAAGVPAVSVPLPGLQDLREYVEVCATSVDWPEAIRRALESSESQRRDMKNYVRRYDWSKLVTSLLSEWMQEAS